MQNQKRTKTINHNRFRKVHTFWKFSAIFVVLNSALFLTGCDEQENVSVYNTIQSCERAAPNDAAKQKCALDYQNAFMNSQKVAPKFNSKEDCESEFGYNQCNSIESTASNVSTSNGMHSSMMFYPIMSGFSSSNNHPSQALYSSKNYSSPMYNKFVDAKGNSFGNFKYSGSTTVARSSLAPKPATSSTTTRGGFGSTVSSNSAKAIVHSSNHSSGRSFGG